MDNSKEAIIGYCQRNKELFTKAIGKFEERGILNSEMLLVCAVSKELDLDILIESGRYRGQSTQVLSKFLDGSKTKVESVEIFRDDNAKYVESALKQSRNVKLYYGDAHYLIPKIVRKNKGKKIGILFDGPKGKKAINIFKHALNIGKGDVLVGFFHDVRKPSKEMPNMERDNVEKSFSECFFTDDDNFLEKFSELDESCISERWKPGLITGKPIGSYGPTLGLVFSSEKDMESAEKEKIYLALKCFSESVYFWLMLFQDKIRLALNLKRRV